MTVTAEQVFNLAMDLMQERLSSGTIDTTRTAVYRATTPGILTILQAELIKQGEIFSTHSISCYPVENILGNYSNFEIEPFEGDELTFEANSKAQAYYFEVDGPCTVYVDDYTDGWNTIATVSCSPTASGFTAYKGVVTPTSGATKSRLRFTGSYYFRTVNRALFDVPFASDSDVPDYRPWVRKQMPDDFKSVDQIIREYADGNYVKDGSYKWEGRRDLYVNYYYEGNIRIVYRPIPAAVTALTDNMQVDDVTARVIIPYGLAAHLLADEKPALANFFQQRYEELRLMATRKTPAREEDIYDYYGGCDA